MGGSSSKNQGAKSKLVNPYSQSGTKGYLYKGQHQQQQHELQKQSKMLTPPQLQESKDKENQEPRFGGYSSSEEEFYDGIPRFHGSSSRKPKPRRVAKVAEVSFRLGRAGSAGLVRTVEALDIIGSSMTNLNLSSGFVSGATSKGNELSILSFEVANTIVKGSTLMHSLSRRSIQQLNDVVLTSEGVQLLVSTDMDELLSIVADDKRKELQVFTGEVVRFGNQCKDPQWHYLDRFFEKYRREPTPQKQLREEAELMMQQLITLVQYTAELYHELHTLDIIEQDYQHKRLEDGKSNASQKGNGLTILAAELKIQKKIIRNLKKKSLWSRCLDEVMDKLVDIALFLNREIDNIFGNADPDSEKKQSLGGKPRLGPAGLDLHYANIILQIDSIVARSSSMPPNARDMLYQNLPPNIKFSLRSKIQSFHVKEQLTVTEIKAEMEKTLQWLVPVATITAKAHHGFGWVGEWANAGSESNRKSIVSADVIQIETLHHADKQKSEAYILELVLWLNYLVAQSKATSNGGRLRSLLKSPDCSSLDSVDRVNIYQ
ncbi:protein PSK SIMULATOR 1-like isoform X1 [Nicotiana tomentosiformis]|nr:uncharacterized protein LOC104089441 isoform X1 [Nicotiana tomentosiformis]XP_009592630.1 uncharacterized protein LOC104089441 isoform X1 [Nicotiana tomentosiformis]